MFQNNLIAGASGQGGFYPYQIEQSLRFNDDDSANLSRTPSSTGNRKTWTWSGWVKRGNLGNVQYLMTCQEQSGNDGIAAIYFEGDQLYTYYDTSGANPYGAVGPALYRDPSSWYHIVWSVDAANTIHYVYVNGVLVSTDASKYPPNYDYAMNRAGYVQRMGTQAWGPVQYFDGYMAEVNFIDGTALDPTSFGETKSGIWVPKAYAGSYGTNGFYLSFADSAAIGDDLSGNGNDWTANNLVATDVLLDSPTNNWATLNPLTNTGGTFTEGNLQYVGPSSGRKILGTTGVSTGKWYWEVAILNAPESRSSTSQYNTF
jgi:hypothetical protein